MELSRTLVTRLIKVRFHNNKHSWIRLLGINRGYEHGQIHSLYHSPTNNMSAHQTELRATRYHRLLLWFGDQQELAPINAIHHSILWQIYQYLVDNADTWGSPDIQNIWVMGDAIVALYDRPLDVVDLTADDDGGADQGSQANDSGIAD
jgi:hypothetical protein